VTLLQFDIRTLALITMVSALAFAGSNFTVWRLMTSERYVRDWFLGALAIASGMLVAGLRGMVPEMFAVLVSNPLLVLGAGLIVRGAAGLLGIPIGLKGRLAPWGLAAATMCLLAILTIAWPNLTARVIVVSAVLGLCSAFSAWLFWTHVDPLLRRMQRATAVVLAVGSLLFVLRILGAPSASVAPDYSATWNLILAAP